MHRARLLIIIIGIFGTSLSRAEEPEPKVGMVIVEPANVLSAEAEDGVYQLTPYRERRGNWGFTVAIGASSYTPVNYEPDFAVEDFDQVYKEFSMPLIELMFSVKRNISIGSVGAEFGVGYYQNQTDSDAVDAELNLTPLRLGAVYYMDAINKDAHYVPYVAGGGYIMMVKEIQASSSYNANTQVAPYVHAGIAFGLDRLDPAAARVSYEDSGIQNTFAYAEVSKMFAAEGAADKDFEDTISFGLGFRIEF